MSPDGGEALNRPSVSVADLERWEDHGAMWRTLEITDERATIELCTCYGEPVDVVGSEEPEVIEFVRARPASAP
jgi:hypothetical protein